MHCQSEIICTYVCSIYCIHNRMFVEVMYLLINNIMNQQRNHRGIKAGRKT